MSINVAVEKHRLRAVKLVLYRDVAVHGVKVLELEDRRLGRGIACHPDINPLNTRLLLQHHRGLESCNGTIATICTISIELAETELSAITTIVTLAV